MFGIEVLYKATQTLESLFGKSAELLMLGITQRNKNPNNVIRGN